jgi:hypothetical protein
VVLPNTAFSGTRTRPWALWVKRWRAHATSGGAVQDLHVEIEFTPGLVGARGFRQWKRPVIQSLGPVLSRALPDPLPGQLVGRRGGDDSLRRAGVEHQVAVR